MKITILMGSPNRNGSTSILVNEFKKGAEEAGHSLIDCLGTWLAVHFLSHELAITNKE